MRKLLFLLLVLLLLPKEVNSATLKKVEDLSLDTSIISEQLTYTTPDSIIVAPIFAPRELNISPIERYRGIFHYLIDRLGYNDLPFHYVVTPEGELIEGNTHGDEAKVVIDNFDKNPVVVAYIANQYSNQFDDRSMQNLKELVSSIANTNSINENNIFVKEIVFTRKRDTRTVSIKIKDLFGTWNSQADEIKLFVASNFSPESKPYSVEVTSVQVPQQTLTPGEIVNVSITVKNTGDYGLYAFTNSELFLTKSDETPSKFYVNNEWESRSQVSIFKENENLLPGEEKTFVVPIFVPLNLGEVKETFKFKTAIGSLVNSNEFEIKINVGESDKKIVEVRDRGFSYYPVYSNPNNATNEIYRAVAGERFFFLQDLGNGWYQIDLGNGQTGWIAFWNVSFIN
ncbi:MAG: hypothetical protein KatS3mg085_177 [Candidatus Dojkabacteria bacterium]|nr:MAG: hypothetical protein KatS3mg085_177 [Candidatus Dojkabacteria bacterium]